MKRNLISLFALAALVLTACESKENTTPAAPEADYSDVNVRIEPLITRVTETDFENGDAIGLTVSREAGVYATNEKLTYDGSAFTGSLKWYAEGADEATLTAYYPYAETVPTSFSVATDQTAGTSSSDFVAASKPGVLPTANAISMVFTHQLSRIVINLTNNAGYTIEGLTLKGSIPTATLDENFAATVDGSVAAADIQAYKSSETSYEAVVVPQTVSFTAAVTAAGVDMSQRLSEVTLLAGKEYTINIIVNPADIQISLSGNVTAWANGGAIGEYEVPFEEHLSDGYFLYDGVQYGVKQLSNSRWIMTDNLAYIPEGYTVSSDPTDGNGIWYPYSSDGSTATALTDATSIDTFGYLYDHQVALGAEVTADNYMSFEGAQGICPKGWHIPTRAEFLAIVGYSNKADGETVAQTDDTAIYYNADYNAACIKEMNDDGMNIVFAGSVMRNTNTATGKYLATVTKSSTCSVEDWIGSNAVTYFMGSTGHTPGNTATNRQFMSLMTTFTGTYSQGRLSVAYSNYLGGYSLRCIRDAE